MNAPLRADARRDHASPRQFFTADQRDALFAAILIDDEVDPHTELPAVIRTDYRQETFSACFGLCHFLWRTGFDRAALVGMVDTLIRRRDLDAADRLRFKHVRARFKHLRYAFALYDEAGRYPPLFDRMTISMGHLQDAYRNRQRRAVLREALLLRLMLTRPVVARMVREAAVATPRSPEAFRAMLEQDRAGLAALIGRDRVTGAEVHVARKIVGRQVSFYDTLRTLRPGPDTFRMSRSLAAINGLMGALHDELVLRKAERRGAYTDERFVLPEAIGARVAALVAVPLEGGRA